MTRRLFAVLSSLWLVLLLAEPAALHVCALHADGMGHTMATAQHGHAGHGTNHHPAHRHSAQCTCLGVSSHSPLVSLPATAQTFVEVPSVATTTLLPAVGNDPRPTAPDFLFPYPNGPPPAIEA